MQRKHFRRHGVIIRRICLVCDRGNRRRDISYGACKWKKGNLMAMGAPAEKTWCRAITFDSIAESTAALHLRKNCLVYGIR